MFTEGILIDSNSKHWNGTDVFDSLEKVDDDEQLINIDGQPRSDCLSDAEHPGDLFPNSVIIVREGVLANIITKIKMITSGNDFPSTAQFIILKERDSPEIIKQLKREANLSAIEVSNHQELKTIIKGHLSDMDPVSDDGINNLHTFEAEVSEITNGMYDNIVPEKYRREK